MKKIIGAGIFYAAAVLILLPCMVIGGMIDSFCEWWDMVKDFKEAAE